MPRQAFLPAAKTLAQGEFTSPEHLNLSGTPSGPGRMGTRPISARSRCPCGTRAPWRPATRRASSCCNSNEKETRPGWAEALPGRVFAFHSRELFRLLLALGQPRPLLQVEPGPEHAFPGVRAVVGRALLAQHLHQRTLQGAPAARPAGEGDQRLPVPGIQGPVRPVPGARGQIAYILSKQGVELSQRRCEDGLPLQGGDRRGAGAVIVEEHPVLLDVGVLHRRQGALEGIGRIPLGHGDGAVLCGLRLPAGLGGVARPIPLIPRLGGQGGHRSGLRVQQVGRVPLAPDPQEEGVPRPLGGGLHIVGKPGDKIYMMATGKTFEVNEVGVFTPKETRLDQLTVGDVGFLTASIKNVGDTQVGDTITFAEDGADEPLAGYRKMNPMVYTGLYPIDNTKYNDLREALEKLQLNDSALQFEAETSQALGFGFRCGFLGLLHMEIIQERIEREFKIDLITTAPSVIYKVYTTADEEVIVDNPSNMPDPQVIARVEEPYVKATIMVPNDYVGAVMEICQSKRGNFIYMDYIDTTRVSLSYEIPLSEIVYDFFDQLKSSTKGYASFDYELLGYQSSKLVKMDILLNGEKVDALSFIVHRDSAYDRGKIIVDRLKELIPRQQFEVPVQAAIGNKIIARSTIKALRKNVLAKCYGGDISRKRKLLEKQKEGKKRMKSVGSVEVPQEAFMSVLKVRED